MEGTTAVKDEASSLSLGGGGGGAVSSQVVVGGDDVSHELVDTFGGQGGEGVEGVSDGGVLGLVVDGDGGVLSIADGGGGDRGVLGVAAGGVVVEESETLMANF